MGKFPIEKIIYIFMPPRNYKHLDTITALFVAVLMISNVAASKITSIGALTFDAATILFPLTYIFGDILTEVYGYARSRKVIWLGIACNVLLALTLMIVTKLPAAADWPLQESFKAILGQTPRIVLASILAFFAGEFANSFVLAKLKVKTAGKFLWLRTIGSTLIGEGIDTAVFVVVAFWGIFPNSLVYTMIVSNYILKVGIETLFTPVTYGIVGWLKRAESEDYYDRNTNFNPFSASGTKTNG